MNGITRAAHAALALVGVLAVAGPTSPAAAQVRRPTAPPAQPAPQPMPPFMAPPRPAPQGATGPRIAFAGEPIPQQQNVRPHFRHPFAPAVIYYYPVPMGYGYYPSGCGASVCDVNGNRVMRGFDEPEPYRPPQSPATVPDLSGSPYLALEGGAIQVDFGNGDRRTIASCAAQQGAMTPDGQPRTIFYAPPADGIVLRQGERGNIVGTPVQGARMCYGLDQYGRVSLIY